MGHQKLSVQSINVAINKRNIPGVFETPRERCRVNPLSAYPAISTSNSNVAKSAYSAGMCFLTFLMSSSRLFPA